MIRDQVMQKKFQSIGAHCFCCQESDHLVRDCGRIHLVPNIEKIVKSKNPNAKHISLYSKQSRQFRVKFNARKGAMLLNEIRAIYMQSIDDESLSVSSSNENQNFNKYSEIGNNTDKSIDNLPILNSRNKFENPVTFHNIDSNVDNKRRRASKLKSLTSSPKMISQNPQDLFFPSFKLDLCTRFAGICNLCSNYEASQFLLPQSARASRAHKVKYQLSACCEQKTHFNDCNLFRIA